MSCSRHTGCDKHQIGAVSGCTECRAVCAALHGTENQLSLLAESLHTGWRKGTDGRTANAIWKLIRDMSPADWGEYVKWVDWCLGEVGYQPTKEER